MLPHPRNKKGFSLIEAAIVLGVVGAVIGSIWVGAAAMYENYKVNKTVDGVFTIAGNVQNLISFRDAKTIGDGANMSDALEDASVVPEGWHSGRIGYISNPLALGGDIYNSMGGQIISFRNFFRINLFGSISESQCMKLVNRTSAIAENLNGNLMQITTRDGYSGPTRTATSFPVSLENTKTLCAGGSYDIYFYFSYTRTN